MEDLIVSLQILAKSWREVSPLVGNGHLSVAADQLEGVLRNHQSAQQSVQSDELTYCGCGEVIPSDEYRCMNCKRLEDARR